MLTVLLLAAAGFYFANIGRTARLYFMTDAELIAVNDSVRHHVDDEVASREDRKIVTALIAVESGGDPGARSPTGAVGLMQLTGPAIADYNAATGQSVTKAALVADPGLNVRVGFWYLRSLETKHGLSRFDALRAFNAGIGTVRRDVFGTASASYAEKILAYAQRLEVLT
jgi:soluble lytic murein transglycosylase-like protein